MKLRAVISAGLAGCMVFAALGIGARSWAMAHVRRWSGRPELGFVTCNHCHLQNLEKIAWAKPHPGHASPAGLVASPDGKKLYAALDELDEVVEIDVIAQKVARKVRVEGAPFGLAIGDSGERLFVACRDKDRVVAISTRELRMVDQAEVGDGPVAITFCKTAAGDRLVVANSNSDNASILAAEPLKEIARPRAGREPYAVAPSPDGSSVFVANRLAVPETYLSVAESELTVIDPAGGRIKKRALLHSAHLAEGAAVVPGRDWCLVPIINVRNLVPITQVANGWVMSSGLALQEANGRLTQLPLDEAHAFFADPSGIAVHPSGKIAAIASGGSDTITILDLERLACWLGKSSGEDRAEAAQDLTLSPEYVLARVPTGRNPRQLTFSPDGRILFVAERLDDSVAFLNTETWQTLGRIRMGNGGLDDPIRRGERVFTSAAHTFQRQFSCRSCHPDGAVDGLSYDFDGDGIGDNLVDNRSLKGVAGTEPLKWIGKNPTLEIQCGPRFARVLMRTDPIPDPELRDLTTFLRSQPPANWKGPRRAPLTTAQERGKAIFFATKTSAGTPIPRGRQCHTCHRPPLFTNRLLASVGSKGARDSTDMFDTPHLLGVGLSAPYLHDGRAKTLEELWTIYQTNDLHGVTSYMNKHQLNDMIEFLKTL